MGKNSALSIFISYSHLDESHVKDFIKHLAPLKTQGFIKEWYDRKIVAGHDFQNSIDNSIEKADIICLIISANFLNSSACMNEKEKSIELNNSRGVVIVPIIISDCGWLDDKDISALLALPTDGVPITKYSNSDSAWQDVYAGIKKVIEQEIMISNLSLKESFSRFLESTELLTKAHSQKESVFIDDIFIYPILIKYDDIGEYDKKESSEKLCDDLGKNIKILIAGVGQSGKTTLCKRLIYDLLKRRFVPIYLNAKIISSLDDINKILQLAEEQYEGLEIEKIPKYKLIPIVDDFHVVVNKEKYLKQLEKYEHQILFVDDIFRMNLKNDTAIKSFDKYKIKEFSPSLRYELIKKWVYLTDKVNGENHQFNEFYQQVDQKTELVDNALGKIIGHGIMPAHPFFILSVISTYESFNISLNEEITSQGHCYQALIYIYLRKQGVRNEDIDTYFNFLTEFSFTLYTNSKNELSTIDFQKFIKYYSSKFNVPIKLEIIIAKLQKCQIIYLNGLGYYSFFYPYLYYYFVAKYLADHCEEQKNLIEKLINNLHKDDNAYITIFISHHSKNVRVLDEVLLNALTLFEKYKPSELSKDELVFFDEQIDMIVKEVLPSHLETPEKKRTELLQLEDMKEEIRESGHDSDENDSEKDDYNELICNLRRSVKTVEVMGQIIKNRSGSLERDRLIMIFEEAMNVHLRVLSSFIELIQRKEGQDEVVEMINASLSKIVRNMKKPPNEEKLEKLSRLIFWNINFEIAFSYIEKIIKSLGSDKLIEIVQEVCDRLNTPATVLIKHGILMSYNKNMQLENISMRIKDTDFSQISKKMMRFLVVNYTSTHDVDYKERQKIEAKLGIPSQRLLIQNIKQSSE
ncbi:MAG: TIR domain-containing protein [Melioribacteraceae bacterium]|nr:TIR domain-containing protein [Melioribacteraceae bacterium]